METQAVGTHAATRAWRPDIEFMPARELCLLQECLLAQVVHRARQTPFFRDRLRQLPADLFVMPLARFQAEVPLTGKADLRQAQAAAWVTDRDTQIALLLATSGTTGTRIMLPYTREDVARWYDLSARTLWTNGLRPEDVVLLPVPLGLFTGGHGMFGGLQRLGCTTVPIGVVHTAQFAELLRGGMGITPTAIVTLPTHMLHLLDALPDVGYDPASSPLRLGSFGAEAWTEAARRRIEEGFGLRAMDSYGLGEICGPGIAAECECREGMHVWEDAFFVEIIDPQSGQPVPDGTSGELVLTNLFRQAFPLLRYRTGDAAALLPEPCACGRTHRRITRIPQRVDDVLIINGVNIYPADIESVLFPFPWLSAEFTLAQGGEHGEALVIQAERHGTAPADGAAQLEEAVRRAYPVRVRVHLHDPGTLERVPGKARRIRGDHGTAVR